MGENSKPMFTLSCQMTKGTSNHICEWHGHVWAKQNKWVHDGVQTNKFIDKQVEKMKETNHQLLH